jgi:pyruvate dehydrogenase E2 component (dihydrolipoamide acetyltransferase)
MAIEFKLPDIGEGIAEGEIVKWLVKVGDTVKEHQSVVEVMTDKATVEVPAPSAGKITEIRAKEGEVVPVGKVIFVLDSASGAAKPDAAKPEAPKAESPKAEAPKPAAAPAPQKSTPAPSGGQATIIDFKLPDIGEGIAEGEIVKWLVNVGDTVKEHQSVVEGDDGQGDWSRCRRPHPAGSRACLRKRARSSPSAR